MTSESWRRMMRRKAEEALSFWVCRLARSRCLVAAVVMLLLSGGLVHECGVFVLSWWHESRASVGKASRRGGSPKERSWRELWVAGFTSSTRPALTTRFVHAVKEFLALEARWSTVVWCLRRQYRLVGDRAWSSACVHSGSRG